MVVCAFSNPPLSDKPVPGFTSNSAALNAKPLLEDITVLTVVPVISIPLPAVYVVPVLLSTPNSQVLVILFHLRICPSIEGAVAVRVCPCKPMTDGFG